MASNGLTPIADVLEGMVRRGNIPGSEDYTDGEGFLMCGRCHTRKQCDVEVPISFRKSGVWRVPIPCECQAAEIEAEKKHRERLKFEQRMKSLQRDGITDPKYLTYTFDQDDRRNPDISDACRKYVENWKDMRADNIGILFYGNVGSGKSYLACCIANALLQQLVSVSVTNFPHLLNMLQGGWGDERQGLVDRLQRYSLLVIDDLGTERDTPYGVEQIFNVVDARSRSGKPLIVTTNLSMQELKSPPSLEHGRIYDRILEMCPIRLKLVGESRRVEKANDKRDKARRLLGLG